MINFHGMITMAFGGKRLRIKGWVCSGATATSEAWLRREGCAMFPQILHGSLGNA